MEENKEILDAVDEELMTEEASLADSIKILSPTKLVIKRFFRSKLSIFGIVTLIILFAFSFIGPLFDGESGKGPIWGETEQDKPEGGVQGDYLYTEIILKDENGNPILDENGDVIIIYDVTVDILPINAFARPSWSHWLGTDQNGYDIFTRLMYGGRISLTLGFVVVFLQTIIGVSLGGLAGYFGKWVDQIIMRIVDVLICLPTFPILIIASAVLESWKVEQNLRIYYLMIVLTFFGWSGTARLVRGQILSLREQEFMLATEALGLSTKRKIFNHLVPNVMPQLIVSMTLGLGGIILTEATLSFLNLGVAYPAAAWGSMINSANNNPTILQSYFNIWGPPGVCIILAILAFNFIGDGLRDAFDPKMKR